METTRQDFGKKLVEVRTIKRLSQQQLADLAGLQQNTISRIERGRFNPGLDILLKISDALDVPLLDI